MWAEPLQRPRCARKAFFCLRVLRTSPRYYKAWGNACMKGAASAIAAVKQARSKVRLFVHDCTFELRIVCTIRWRSIALRNKAGAHALLGSSFEEALLFHHLG